MNYLKIRFLNKLLEKDITKTIFDNIRNFLYCALFFAFGVQAVSSPSSTFGFNETGIVISGVILITISLLLMGLNMLDGIYKLSKMGINSYVYPVFILLYILVVIRVVIFATGYRLH